MLRPAILCAALCACTAYDPSLPESPFFCGTADPKCPDGYTCVAPATGKSVCRMTTGSTTTDGGIIPPGGCTMPFSGVLATWTLTSETGSQTSTAAASMATGIVAGSLSRSSALTAAAGTGSINASNWPTAAQLDSTKYFTLAVAPPAGCAIDVTSLLIDAKSSGTGPTSAGVGTSNDSFGHTSLVATNAPSMIAQTLTGVSGNLEIRIFGFGASASSGTMRIQNDLTVSGSIH